VALAAIYAQEALGFSTADTITMVLAVNVTAALGAFGFGQVQDRLGHVRTLTLTLLVWIATILCAWLADRHVHVC
jgi:UMF1 family MFS transporter